jgi:nucleoside-diphosphate-sugar epimerase
MEEELVVPNIALAEQLVRACAAAGARLVLTSSMAAVRGTRQPLAGGATAYTAADWNAISRRDGPGFEPYQYSKMESERRAWELARELSDESMLVSLCPPMLLGPPLDAASNAYSCELMRGWLDGTRPVRSLLMADVRDVALAHVRAAEEKSAGGRRLIVSSETRISAAEMASAITAAAAELGRTLDNLCVDDAETGGLIATGEREVESEEILAAALSVRCRPDAESLAEMAAFLLCAARQPA